MGTARVAPNLRRLQASLRDAGLFRRCLYPALVRSKRLRSLPPWKSFPEAAAAEDVAEDAVGEDVVLADGHLLLGDRLVGRLDGGALGHGGVIIGVSGEWVSGRKSEVGGQTSEVRSQMSEVRSQKSEIRSQKLSREWLSCADSSIGRENHRQVRKIGAEFSSEYARRGGVSGLFIRLGRGWVPSLSLSVMRSANHLISKHASVILSFGSTGGSGIFLRKSGLLGAVAVGPGLNEGGLAVVGTMRDPVTLWLAG